jgi:IPT/TIG domain-containing protein
MRAAALVVIVGTSLTSVVGSTAAGASAGPRPPKPVITQVDPKVGPTTGGTVVTIRGSHLTGASAVLFGTDEGTKVKVRSDHKLTVVAPAHGEGVVDVRVRTKGGRSAKVNTARFTYALEKPAVTGLTPDSGPLTGGNVVTVSGSGFTAVTAVTFAGTPGTSVVVVSPTQLSVVAPAHDPGLVHVNVTNAAGTSPTKVADQYHFLA